MEKKLKNIRLAFRVYLQRQLPTALPVTAIDEGIPQANRVSGWPCLRVPKESKLQD